MTSLNVRLSVEDEEAVAALQERGINVSEVVRDAIRARYHEVVPQRPSAEKLIAAVIAAHPGDDRNARKSRPHPLDRKAFANALAARVRRARG